MSFVTHIVWGSCHGNYSTVDVLLSARRDILTHLSINSKEMVKHCLLFHANTHIPPSINSLTTVSPSTVTSRNRCLKCGIAKKSGKRSCCARGGAWFKNCGDADDTKFDHTWIEGIEACKSRSWRGWWFILLTVNHCVLITSAMTT